MRSEQEIRDRLEILINMIQKCYESGPLEGVEYYEEEKDTLKWVLEGE